MNLFRLKINGKFVVIGDDTTVKLVINTGIFKFDTNKPTRTYNFKVPAAANVPIFGIVNNMFTRDVVTDYYNCEAYIGSNLYGKCRVIIMDWNETTLTIQVVFNDGAYEVLGERRLRSFEYKNPYPFRFKESGCYSTLYRVNAPVSSGTYSFTLTIPPINDRYNAIVKTFVFVYTGLFSELEAMGLQIIDYMNSIASTTSYVAEADSLSPSLFNVYAAGTNREPSIDLVWSAVVTRDSDNIVSQATALATLYTESLDNSKDYVFAPLYTPKILNEDLYAGSPSSITKNRHLNPFTPKVIGNPSYPGTPIPWIFAPFARLSYVLKQIHAELGISVDFDSLFDAENNSLFMMNDEPMNVNDKKAYKYYEYRASHVFRYSEILPDITVSDLLTAIRFNFNTLIRYNTATQSISIKKIEDILTGNSVDLTSKFILGKSYSFKPNLYTISYKWPSDDFTREYMPNFTEADLAPSVNLVTDLPATPRVANSKELRFVIKENKYYYWDYPTTSWLIYADGLYPLTQETSSKNISITSTPLVCIPFPWRVNADGLATVYDVKYMSSITAQTGNNGDMDFNTPSLRLMYYRGMQPCKVKILAGSSWADGEYPMLSNHNYNINGVKIGNKSLSINAEDGIYNTYYKKFIERCASNSPMKLRFNFNEADLTTINFDKIMVENHEYLVDEIEVEIGTTIKGAIATVYPIISK